MRKVLIGLLLLAGCRPSPPAGPPAPAAAKVENPVKESELTKVVLTPEAVTRLGIKTVSVERKKVERIRSLGGEAVIPPGQAVTVVAPLAGTLSGTPPAAGQKVAAGHPVFVLTPYLTAESRASLGAMRVEAEGAMEGAKVQLDAAQIALARAEQLLKDKAGSQRAVDDARAQRDMAQATLKAAQARREILTGATAGTLGPIPVAAPIAGVVRRLDAAPGQQVPAGAPLFEIANVERLWIRVPIHVGDVARIETEKEITVEGLAARRVAAPPAADRDAATVELFYEVDNAKGTLRPAQKVVAPLPLRGEEESLVVPSSAILHDVLGGTWVYEKTADRTFVRRRVQVRNVAGPEAVLASGPPPGTNVVAEGAMELFGTEFFVSK